MTGSIKLRFPDVGDVTFSAKPTTTGTVIIEMAFSEAVLRCEVSADDAGTMADTLRTAAEGSAA